MNAGDKNEPGVMLSSFLRALTAPGHPAILQIYLETPGHGGGGGGWSPDKKQKVLRTKRVLQKCLKRHLEKKYFSPRSIRSACYIKSMVKKKNSKSLFQFFFSPTQQEVQNQNAHFIWTITRK